MGIFKIYRAVCCCVRTLILLLTSMCGFHGGALPTRQRILGPRGILLISLRICRRWDTARIPWQSPWHRIKLLRFRLEPVLIVILRASKFLLIIKGCLFRWTTQSIAFNLELYWLILRLFIILLLWTPTPYHYIRLIIYPLQWLSGLLLKRKWWHSISLIYTWVEWWHGTVFNVRSDPSPRSSSLLLQFIVLILKL